jgi:hypothetical protein
MSIGTASGGAAWPGVVSCPQPGHCLVGQRGVTAKVSLHPSQWQTEGQAVWSPVYGCVEVGGMYRAGSGRCGSTTTLADRKAEWLCLGQAWPRDEGWAADDDAGTVGPACGTSSVCPESGVRTQLAFLRLLDTRQQIREKAPCSTTKAGSGRRMSGRRPGSSRQPSILGPSTMVSRTRITRFRQARPTACRSCSTVGAATGVEKLSGLSRRARCHSSVTGMEYPGESAVAELERASGESCCRQGGAFAPGSVSRGAGVRDGDVQLPLSSDVSVGEEGAGRAACECGCLGRCCDLWSIRRGFRRRGMGEREAEERLADATWSSLLGRTRISLL